MTFHQSRYELSGKTKFYFDDGAEGHQGAGGVPHGVKCVPP